MTRPPDEIPRCPACGEWHEPEDECDETDAQDAEDEHAYNEIVRAGLRGPTDR